MHDLLALRGFFFGVLLFAVSLFATWGAVSQGFAEMLVPTPQNTAEEFLRAMKAHRYEAAHELLAEQLREEVSEEELRDLGSAIEVRHGPVSEAFGKAEEEQGETAMATATLRFEGGKEQEIALPLTEENDLWRIDSLEPLLNMAG